MMNCEVVQSFAKVAIKCQNPPRGGSPVELFFAVWGGLTRARAAVRVWGENAYLGGAAPRAGLGPTS